MTEKRDHDDNLPEQDLNDVDEENLDIPDPEDDIPLNLKEALAVAPEIQPIDVAPVKGLPVPIHIVNTGYKLTRLVLILLTIVFVLWSAVFVYVNKNTININNEIKKDFIKQIVSAKDNVNTTNVQHILDALEQSNKNSDNFRTFWLDTLKSVLINVLLPILTALIGYTFGIQQSKEKQLEDINNDS